MIRYTVQTEIKAYQRKKTQAYKFSGCPYKIAVPGIRGRAGEPIYTDCKKCLYCLVKKQSALEFIAKKELIEEYKKGHGASFITLTYNEEYIPRAIKKCYMEGEKTHPIYKSSTKTRTIEKNGIIDVEEYKEESDFCMARIAEIKDDVKAIKLAKDGQITLYKKDFKDFMKNVRRQIDYRFKNVKDKPKLKVIYCGEYGDQTTRAHMHLIMIGLTQAEAAALTNKCWKYGIIDIGTLGQGGIRYLVDYVTKSQTTKKIKEQMEEYGIEPPFIYHSINMGKEWILKNEQELIKNNFYVTGNKGQRTLLPTKIIKDICIRNDINYKNVFEKLYNNRIKNAKRKADEKGISADQFLFEERMLKEMNNYQCIRQKVNEQIEIDYMLKIADAKNYLKPKSRKIKPLSKLSIEAAMEEREIEEENFKAIWDYFDTMQTIENIKKNAKIA